MCGSEVYPQVFVALAASGGAFIFGILLGWSAPTASSIVKKDEDSYYFWVTENQFALIVALMALGAAIGSSLSGMIRSKLGTKITILLYGLPILIGWTLITFPMNPVMLMIGRFLCGLSAGCYSYIIPIYIGEISSDEYRGAMLSIFQVGLNLGIFFVFTVGHFASIRILNIICGIIPILFSLGFLGLPESPALLISQNRETNAMKSLEKLRGGFEDVESELEALKIRNEQVRAQAKTFNEVFKTRSTLKAFAIIMLQFFFFQMTGINVVYLYATTIFTEAGISLDAGLASITVVGVQVVATFIAVGLVDRFGRKIMLSFSNCLMGLGLVAIGTYFTLKDSGTPVDSLGWLPLTSLCIYVIAFSSGMGPVSYILLGELFLQDAKAFVAPISQVFNFLLLFTISLTFPMLTSSIGNGLTFFIFAGFCALSMLFTIFFIPETKGKSVSEIQNILR